MREREKERKKKRVKRVGGYVDRVGDRLTSPKREIIEKGRNPTHSNTHLQLRLPALLILFLLLHVALLAGTRPRGRGTAAAPKQEVLCNHAHVAAQRL
jgi:hypothetical protein